MRAARRRVGSQTSVRRPARRHSPVSIISLPTAGGLLERVAQLECVLILARIEQLEYIA